MGGGMYEAEFVVTRSGQYDLQVRQLYLPWLYVCSGYTCLDALAMAALALAIITR